jgi:Putative Flp pilus-assembly TadE/G-like
MTVRLPSRHVVKLPSDRDGERGAILALVALGMFVLLGAVALGVDGNRVFEERRSAQAAVDHAATSAAYAECSGGTPAQAVIAGRAAAQRNGYDNDGTTNTVNVVDTGNIRYWATIDSTIPSTFAGVLGIPSFDVSVEATASAVGCGAGGSGPGAIYGGGTTCGSSSNPLVDVPGSTQRVYGGIHSNFTSRVGGSTNIFTNAVDTMDDPFTYVTSHSEAGSGNVYQPGYPAQTAVPSPQWPAGFDPSLADSAADAMFTSYQALAVANGTYFTNKVTTITKDGVYYTTHTDGMDIGSISLPGGDANGQADVVLVAPNGPIKVSISGLTMNPYGHDSTPPFTGLPRDGLLIVSGKQQTTDKKCDDYTVSLSGSGSTWNGIIWGGGGLVEFNGSSNSAVNGTLIGWGVRLNGSNIQITFDPDLFDDPQEILLLE